MENLLIELLNDTDNFYKAITRTHNFEGPYEGKKIKLIVERRFLEDLWNQSKKDMENEKETIGIVRGYLRKIRSSGENYFRYYPISANRVQSGLSEKEIEEKHGCLAPFIGGEVEIENALSYLENNTGIYHTHPLVTSLRYKRLRFPPRYIEVPARFSETDNKNHIIITNKLKEARNNKVCLLPFCVSTCYAEAKVVWDILFQLILPRYTSIKNPIDIKREVFEKDLGHGILNRVFSSVCMGEDLKFFYEAVTRKDCRNVIENANHFLGTLNEKGYTSSTKLTGSDISTICEWIKNPILWEIAKEDGTKSGNLASFELVLANTKSHHSYQFPLYASMKDKQIGLRLCPIGIEYYGSIADSQEVVNFKQTYKKKFKKEFRGIASEIKESNNIVLHTIPEILEVFGHVDPNTSLNIFLSRTEKLMSYENL